MKKSEVPTYLQGTDFFQSLSDEDNSDILVPDNCCKLNTDVSTLEELRQLLSTIRFWGLQVIPASCIKFVMQSQDVNLTSVLQEFDSTCYLYQLMCKLELARSMWCHYDPVIGAVECGALEALHFYASVYGTPMHRDYQLGAIEHNKFECFEFLYGKAKRFADNLCEHAAEHHRLRFLQFARVRDAPWGNTLRAAVTHRSWECLNYALEQGCPGVQDAIYTAATAGHVDILKHLLAINDGKWQLINLCDCAARSTYKCLRYVHNSGYPMTSQTLVSAATSGKLKCMKYARKHGCEWTTEVVTAALSSRGLDCFIYAHQHGCPLPVGIAEHAASRGRYEHIKYLCTISEARPLSISMAAVSYHTYESLEFVHKLGCPVDISVMRHAAHTGGSQCVRYMHEALQVPWDASVCAAAATGGHMNILRYLHESSCPWDCSTIEAAALGGHKHCLEYACQNGCDRTGLAELAYRSALLPAVKQYLLQLM